MKKTALLGAALGLALSFGAASMASATTYTFMDSDCCGTGPFGTVEVTQGATANILNFTVQLAAGDFFHPTDDKNHHALAFDLVGDPNVTISSLTSGFTTTPANGHEDGDPNGIDAPPFPDFDYVINLPKSSATNLTTFSFTVTGGNPLTLGYETYGSDKIYFATDVSKNGVTGNVGATLTPGVKGGVPEPASWAMMLVGFGGVGAILRRRRSQALALA